MEIQAYNTSCSITGGFHLLRPSLKCRSEMENFSSVQDGEIAQFFRNPPRRSELMRFYSHSLKPGGFFGSQSETFCSEVSLKFSESPFRRMFWIVTFEAQCSQEEEKGIDRNQEYPVVPLSTIGLRSPLLTSPSALRRKTRKRNVRPQDIG